MLALTGLCLQLLKDSLLLLQLLSKTSWMAQEVDGKAFAFAEGVFVFL